MPSDRLLVIDDEPAISATIGRIARGCGYDTAITTDSEDFLSKISSWMPTVIVLDLAIPEMDGYQLLRWMADHECKAQILIISGSHMDRLQGALLLGESLGLKMAGRLQKPLHVEQLREVFQQIYDSAGVLSIRDVSAALKGREIHLVYQPQIEIATGNTVAFEALARWNHPKRGPIPPADFIPLLESGEVIHDFTASMLEIALADLNRWDIGDLAMAVAVNVSAANCARRGLVDAVRSLCSQAQIDCRRIKIEVTETAAMIEGEDVKSCLGGLHQAGVSLSIDDFGTGYSSLVKLQELPFSELKIDRSFVTTCNADHQRSVLVKAMIDLAHHLNMTVVAEGVEDGPTLLRLQEWGCDFAQGYFISRPISSDDVPKWLTDQRKRST